MTNEKRPRQIAAKPDPKRIAAAPDPKQIGKSPDPKQLAERAGKPHTLVIDVGGTGIKMIVTDSTGAAINPRARELTPERARPRAVLRVVQSMIPHQPPFDRISVGFPGIIKGGIVYSAANLNPEAWHGFDLQAALFEVTGRPTRVLNDADLQGYGVIVGEGVELALTLGTGMGAALFTDGHLVPNLELGHHPYKKGMTYEQRIGDKERKRIGKQKWRHRLHGVFDTLNAIFNPDIIWIGGGNTKKLRPEDVPHNGRVFTNVDGLRGGVRLWKDS